MSDVELDRSWVLALPAGTRLLNSNERLHWRKRADITRDIRQTACVLARATRIPRLERAQIIAEYRPPNRARRDPANLYPAVKAAVDGIVDAGVLPDDSAQYLVGPDMRLGETIVPRGQLVFHVRALPAP